MNLKNNTLTNNNSNYGYEYNAYQQNLLNMQYNYLRNSNGYFPQQNMNGYMPYNMGMQYQLNNLIGNSKEEKLKKVSPKGTIED